MKRVLALCAAMGLLVASSAVVLAQDNGGQDRGQRRQRGEQGEGQEARRFDPEQMRQRMMEGIKERLGASDEEWQVLEPKVQKVMEAQQNARAGGMGMMGFGGGRGGFGGPGGRGGPEGDQSELGRAAQELRTVLQNENASAEQINQRLAAYREARQKAEAELNAARDDLRGLVTQRQEAMLVMSGLLE